MESGTPGGETTLLRVFREQRPRLWGFLLRAVGRPETAEDLLQEAFIRAWEHRRDLGSASEQGDREAARRYIWRVIRNLAIDEIRASARRRRYVERPRPVGETGEAEVPDPGPGPAERIEHADCLRAIRETVDRLPNRRARRCLQLWLEGRELTEVAAGLGLAIGQVRGLLQRGKAEVILRATDRLRGAASPRAASAGDEG